VGPEVEAVAVMMSGFKGRLTFAELRARYDEDPSRPMVSDKALARAARACGAVEWRTGRARGWQF
jgi:hypothetical protein